MAQETAAKVHKEGCSGIGALSAYLDMLETNLAILERCKEPVSEAMLLQIVEDRLKGVSEVAATLAEWRARTPESGRRTAAEWP